MHLQFNEDSTQFRAFRGQNGISLPSSLRLESVEKGRNTLPRAKNFRAAEGDLIERSAGACKYRTTSRLSGQTFCLEFIAGFDIQEIIEASTREGETQNFPLADTEPAQSYCFLQKTKDEH